MMVMNLPTSKPIEFSGNMLYHPSYPEMKNIGTHPYITDTIDYSNLNIADLTYPQIAAIFFDRSKFIQMVSKINEVKENDKPATLERNVMTMLRLLLPTKFFAVNNHKHSIKLLDPDVVDSSSILYNPLKTESSYINIQGKPYTITEVVWLNDILNHPKYRMLLEEVYNLNRTLNTYKTTLMSKMRAYIKRITDLMDDIYNLIKEAISGTGSGSGVRTQVQSGYENEKTYSAIFTILRLKKLLTGEPVDVSAIYNELYGEPQTADKVIQSVPVSSVTIATNPFAKITKTTSGIITLEDQLIGIATEHVTDIKSSPIQISRFEKVLALMSEYSTELSDIIKLADNADKVALVTKTNELFSETVLKEGSNLAAQLKATDSIVFSNQTYGSSDYIPVLSQFKTNTLYKYRRPYLTSENKNLQDYIDNDTNPALVTEWVKQFVEIYNMYVLKSTALKTTENLATIKKLLRLGINNINIETTDNTIPKIEMYVKMHLIDGVVTNYNKYQIYCPLTSDKLGSELLALLKNPTDYANLLNEDVSLFDVKTLSSTNSASNVQNDEKQPLNVPRNQNVQYNKNVQYNRNVPNPNIRSTMFGPVIASAKPDELNELITNINRNPEFNLNSNPESIISFISSTYNDARTSSSSDYLPDLPNIIYKWNISDRRPNKKLEEQITRMNATLTAEQTILENKLNDVKTIANPTEQSKVTNKLDIIKFYKYIGELLLLNEQKKPLDRQPGGKKNNKKYTAKRRTKYINSKSRRRKKH